MLIVADVAGEFGALERLVARVPETEKIILLGDLIDRGRKSFEVVDWAFRNQDRISSIMGNHEHMAIDYFGDRTCYDVGVWVGNGGHATIQSYRGKTGSMKITPEHLEYLKGLPHFIETETLLLSHCPVNSKYDDLEELARLTKESPLMGDSFLDLDGSLLWNRSEPKERTKYQIFGHNSHWGLRYFDDYAVCIDQSRSKVLTGAWIPDTEQKTRYDVGSLNILTEPY